MKKCIAVMALLMFLPFSLAQAHEDDRIEKLEQEVEELRLQLYIVADNLMTRIESKANELTENLKLEEKVSALKSDQGTNKNPTN